MFCHACVLRDESSLVYCFPWVESDQRQDLFCFYTIKYSEQRIEGPVNTPIQNMIFPSVCLPFSHFVLLSRTSCLLR